MVWGLRKLRGFLETQGRGKIAEEKHHERRRTGSRRTKREEEIEGKGRDHDQKKGNKFRPRAFAKTKTARLSNKHEQKGNDTTSGVSGRIELGSKLDRLPREEILRNWSWSKVGDRGGQGRQGKAFGGGPRKRVCRGLKLYVRHGAIR